jgi:hypothetical protein
MVLRLVFVHSWFLLLALAIAGPTTAAGITGAGRRLASNGDTGFSTSSARARLD